MSLLTPGYQRLAEQEQARQAAIHRVAALPWAHSFSAGDVQVVTTAADAEAWAERLHQEKVSLLGVDTEFTFDRPAVPLPGGKEFLDVASLRPQVCTVAAWCAAATTPAPAAPLIRLLFDLRRSEVYPGLRAVFDLHVPWVAHAAKAEFHCLSACGIEPAEHLLIDTYVTAACLHMGRFHKKHREADPGDDPGEARRREEKRAHITSLVGQCEHYGLGYPFDKGTKDALRQRFCRLGPDDPLDGDMIAYAISDAEYALRLHLAQGPDVQRLGLTPHLAAVEWPLVGTVARMERAGLPVSTTQMAEYRGLCLRIVDVLAERLVGHGITPGSAKSFLDEMGRLGLLEHFRHKGKLSTKQQVLREAEAKQLHPAVRLFRLHRYFGRMVGDKLLAGELVSADGRQRCDLDQLRSVSGRIASSRPNLIGLDKKLRPFCLAPPGWVLIELDYSQKEVGLAGAEWHEEELVKQFNLGDSYSGVAQLFYADRLSPGEKALSSKDFKKARPELRNNVKSLVLGILYGRGASGIAEAFGCSLAHAEVELTRFFDLFPKAREGAARAVRASLARGYGLTVTGLRRFIEPGDDRARNQMRNHPIQGGAAAIFKTALARIGGYFRGTKTQLLLPRHDSILLLTPEGTQEEVISTCRVIMVQAVREKYPELQPRVDAKVGNCWPTELRLEDFFDRECQREAESEDDRPAGCDSAAGARVAELVGVGQ
jgi:DNA polymerase I-like protein with 3'-5' exonuclease and polymerase domains